MAVKLAPEKVKQAIGLQSQGYTQAEIAAKVGCGKRTIERYLTAYNRRLMLKLTSRAEGERARQVTVLGQVVSTALRSFERSAEDAVTVKTITEDDDRGGDESAPADRTETTVKGQAGTPGFLAEARSALADIRKILGLDEPTDSEASAAALVAIGSALETVISALPPGAQAMARENAAAALLAAGGEHGRRGG